MEKNISQEYYEEDTEPPTHRISDYVDIALLSAMIAVGGPLNAVGLYRTVSALGVAKRRNGRGSTPTRRVVSRLTLFKLHLTIANLMVLATYAVSQISWIITYEWLGGDAICRIVKFLHTFCFYATSNLVAAIAVDRLWVMFYVNKPRSFHSSRSTRRLQICAWTAWVIAFISSVPQFFLWRTIEAWPNWYQCVTYWMAKSMEDATFASKVTLYEKVYGGLHLALVFWSPALIIILCYALIVARFHIYENRGRNDTVPIRINNNLIPSGTKHPFNQRTSCASTCSGDEASSAVSPHTNELGSTARALLSLVTISATNLSQNSTQNSQLQLHPTQQEISTTSVATNPTQVVSTLFCRPLLENFSVATLRRAKRRTLKKTAWLLLCYIICWSPYNLVALWRHFFNPAFENIFLDSFYNLIVLNAVLNPLIYGV